MPQGPLIDHKNKVIMAWTAKSGCTVAVKMFFHHMGILQAALRYNSWVHRYRWQVFYNKYGFVKESDLRNPDYFKFKVVRNPYTRVVSSYIHAINKNKFYGTFARFTKQLLNKTMPMDQHWRVQRREDPRLFDFIVYLEDFKNGIAEVNRRAGTHYITSFSSDHHLEKTKATRFVGKKWFKAPVERIPDYKYFYNDAILDRVTRIYKVDIDAYGYRVPFTL